MYAAYPAKHSASRAYNFFCSGVSVSHLGNESGHSVSCVLAGITPSFFWLAKIWSRSAFQPMSNLPLNFSIHSFLGWCGECVPPGTKYRKNG